MLALLVSRTYLFKSKSARISLIVSIFAITLSCAAFVVVSAVMNGMHGNIVKQFTAMEGNAFVYGKTLNQSTVDHIENMEGVEIAIMTLSKEAVFLQGGRSKGVVVRGVSNLPPNIKTESQDLPPNSALVGSDLSKLMGIEDGEVFSIGFLDGNGLSRWRLTSQGNFTSPFKVYDGNVILVNLKDLQARAGLADQVEKIQVHGDDAAMVGIGEKLGNQLTLKQWFEGNPNMQAAMKFEKWGMNVVLVCILIIASFSIASSTLLLLRERQKDVALINVLGGSNMLIFSIFSLIGLMMGGIGGILGVSIGIMVSLYLGTLVLYLEQAAGFQLLDWSFQGIEPYQQKLDLKR